MKYLPILFLFLFGTVAITAQTGVFDTAEKGELRVDFFNLEHLHVHLDFNAEVTTNDVEKVRRVVGVDNAFKSDRYGINIWVGKNFDRRATINTIMQRLGKRRISKKRWKINTVLNPQLASNE